MKQQIENLTKKLEALAEAAALKSRQKKKEGLLDFMAFYDGEVSAYDEIITRLREILAGEEQQSISISDPNGIMKLPYADIYSKSGTKVIVTEQTLNFGYSHHSEQAKKFLIPGKIYTIEKTDVLEYSSTFELKEFPGEKFNSAHFLLTN